MKSVAIIGAASLTGEKLIEILNSHPKAEVALATSNTFAGKAVSGSNIKYEVLDIQKIKEHDVIFSCLPHGKSMEILPSLVEAGKLVIDLGADFRTPADVFKKWYGTEHKAKDKTPATYGLSEVFTEEIKGSNFIANPGCYPTSVLLALAPLLSAKVKLEDINISSLSGYSGAGREQAKKLAEQKGNAFSYKNPYNHQHIGEMEHYASVVSGTPLKLFSFSPTVLCDVFQGMHTTIVGKCMLDSAQQLMEMFDSYYDGQPFIKIHSLKDKQLGIKDVFKSNDCLISLDYNLGNKRLYIISVIDNLVKGASGQAVQNMNLALGLQATTGLSPNQSNGDCPQSI